MPSISTRAAALLLGAVLAHSTAAAQTPARIDNASCQSELWNVDQLNGLQAQLSFALSAQPLGTDVLRAKFLEGTSKIPFQVRGQIANLRDGVSRGLTAPRATVERVIGQLDQLLAADGSPMLQPPRRDTDPDFMRQWLEVARDSVAPFLRDYRTFLSSEYLAHARPEPALVSMPGGAACYKSTLFLVSGMPINTDSMYVEAVRRRSALAAEIQRAAPALFGSPLSAIEVLRRVRTDSQFVIGDPDSVLAAYGRQLDRARTLSAKLFSFVPEGAIQLRAIPQMQAASAAPAQYVSARAGSGPAAFLVNAYQPGGVAKMNIIMGVVHEAYPGHHFQHLYAEARRTSRTPNTSSGAYVEGWGIYSERIADEAGLYDSDLARVGYLTHLYDVFTALEIDIGMHARGWTRAQAIDTMMIVAGRPRAQAESYADRHAATPGQLASYGIGYLAIVNARENAERELGAQFDLAAFHDVVLSDGSVTLPQLQKRVEEWVRQRKIAPGAVRSAGPFDYDMVTVAPNTYTFIERKLGWSVSGNITAVVGGDGILIFDAGHHAGISRQIIADLKRITDKPVKYVVLSHWHDDHWVATSAFTDAFPKAQVIAHEFTAKMLETRRPIIHGEPCRAESRDQIKALHAELDTAKRPDGSPISEASRKSMAEYIESADAQMAECDENVFRAPDRKIKDKLDVDLGGRRVQIMWLGRANTAGDLVAYVPDTKTFLAGDVIVFPWPFATQSYISEWVKVLRTIEAMDVSDIVPGHGAVLHDKSYVRSLAELFTSIMTQARAAYHTGITLEDLAKHVDVAAFRERFAHGDRFIGDNFDAQISSAIDRMWQELSGKLKPEGD